MIIFLMKSYTKPQIHKIGKSHSAFSEVGQGHLGYFSSSSSFSLESPLLKLMGKSFKSLF